MSDGSPCRFCTVVVGDLLFPSPNPTGYCWNVTSIAANGKESPASDKWRFSYVDFAPDKVSPGIQIGSMATLGKTSILEGDSYGSQVTFQWNSAPDAVAYGFKLGRYPWAAPLATPDPPNCWVPLGFEASFSCTSEPVLVTHKETVGDTGLILDGSSASQGRYCWTIWPIIEGDRQPLIDSFPQLCYTSGPAKPEIKCDNVPDAGAGYTGETIKCTLTAAYVPAGQLAFDVTVDGNDAGDQLEIVSKCKPDPDPPQPHDATFGDIYDCVTKFNIHPQPKQHVVITAHTWNSDKSPPVKDDDSKVHDVPYEFDTGSCGGKDEGCCPDDKCNTSDLVCGDGKCLSCGDKGLDCCGGNKCNASNLVCSDDDSAATNHRCKLKPPSLPAPKLLWDIICDPALVSSLWTNNATAFLFTDVPNADEFEFEFIDPDTLETSARTPATNCEMVAGSDLFCPATSDSPITWMCNIPSASNFSYHWSDAKENAANQKVVEGTATGSATRSSACVGVTAPATGRANTAGWA